MVSWTADDERVYISDDSSVFSIDAMGTKKILSANSGRSLQRYGSGLYFSEDNRICRIMLKEVNLLVLDEPTNHLDVDAKESLKKAIKDYKGTVLIVSHEPEFYMDIADNIWNIEEWSTKII